MKFLPISVSAFFCVLFLSSFTPITNPITLSTDTSFTSCNLPAPSTFQASRISGNAIALNWSPVSGASAYKLSVYEVTNDGYRFISQSEESGLGKVQGGLQGGKTYHFTLAAMCGANAASDFIITSDDHP